MKSIAVISTDKEYAIFLTKHLSKYLNKYADFTAYSVSEIRKLDAIPENTIILPNFKVFQKVSDKIDNNSEAIVVSVALTHEQIRKLREIPAGTRALLVNFDIRACMHSIDCIYEAGIRDVELIPYCGEGDYDTSINIAITPNECQLVPDGIDKIFNVGESAVDMNSLYRIADKLGVYDSFISNEAYEARNEYYYINSSMDRLLSDNELNRNKIDALIGLMKDGIIITDSSGKIYTSNKKADLLLQKRSRILQGFMIEEILPEIPILENCEQLIKVDKADLMISVVEIKSSKELAGHIITLNDFAEMEKKQHGIRNKLTKANHSARFQFKDILGTSESIKSVVKTAQSMAMSDSSIMIIGETGTGKELFAQSIHNASKRRNFNFVAINCAAIPEQLLESELFGYERGSFTGARQEGKIGLFELAHLGTIFLDEIAEMPMSLQAKLLRVLEEKKVMRLGSNKNIDIDVRVISATNKNLYRLVEEGRFREDLYYRLNVLPLEIPPLRERREDIMIIIQEFLLDMKSQIKFTPQVVEILNNREWKGNVRELRNVTEYLVSKGSKLIDAGDLPCVPKKNKQFVNESLKPSDKIYSQSTIDKFLLYEGRNLELYNLILKELLSAYDKGKRCGRHTLFNSIKSKGYIFSEGEIRKALSKLALYGFVRSNRGRGGSTITKEGVRLNKIIEDFKTTGTIR